jgi:hypothetical protein
MKRRLRLVDAREEREDEREDEEEEEAGSKSGEEEEERDKEEEEEGEGRRERRRRERERERERESEREGGIWRQTNEREVSQTFLRKGFFSQKIKILIYLFCNEINCFFLKQFLIFLQQFFCEPFFFPNRNKRQEMKGKCPINIDVKEKFQ